MADTLSDTAIRQLSKMAQRCARRADQTSSMWKNPTSFPWLVSSSARIDGIKR